MRMVSKNNDQVEIGENIRLLRESKDMSQDQLADILGTNRKAVSRYETGAQEMGVNTFVQYVDALEADPSQLLPQRILNRKGSSLMTQLETVADGLSEGDMIHLIQYAKRLKTGSW